MTRVLSVLPMVALSVGAAWVCWRHACLLEGTGTRWRVPAHVVAVSALVWAALGAAGRSVLAGIDLADEVTPADHLTAAHLTLVGALLVPASTLAAVLLLRLSDALLTLAVMSSLVLGLVWLGAWRASGRPFVAGAAIWDDPGAWAATLGPASWPLLAIAATGVARSAAARVIRARSSRAPR